MFGPAKIFFLHVGFYRAFSVVPFQFSILFRSRWGENDTPIMTMNYSNDEIIIIMKGYNGDDDDEKQQQ